LALDDLGLHQAVAQHLEELAERSQLEVDLANQCGRPQASPAGGDGAVPRLQEAVSNVVKHAGADRLGVVLEAARSEVRLIAEDDGRGFA
jgi:signal transduction histidine kinase